VRPLQQRVERIERELSERARVIPKVGFGFAVPESREPAQESQPYSVLGNLIKDDGIKLEIESARRRAAEDPETFRLASSLKAVGSAFRPTAEEFEGYAQRLHKWFIEVQDLFFVDFVFANTGGAPAEAVQVIMQMPAMLRPKRELPVRPAEPSRDPYGVNAARIAALDVSKSSVPASRPRPDRIIGPRINIDDASGIAVVVWEVPTLYHDRHLITRSIKEPLIGTKGLLISGRGLREHQSQAGAGAQLKYTIRAANVPEAVQDVLILRTGP
jgi:hypothetical protein